VQGPWGPGSLKVGRRHEPPFAEREEIPRREDGWKETVAAAADAESSVNVLVRAEPVVHYTINSTVNGHNIGKATCEVGNRSQTVPIAEFKIHSGSGQRIMAFLHGRQWVLTHGFRKGENLSVQRSGPTRLFARTPPASALLSALEGGLR